MVRRVVVAKVSEIEPNKGKLVRAAGRGIALFRLAEGWFAVDNTCPHEGGPLAEGTLADGRVTCPWHAYTFMLATGRCLTDPSLRVATYPVVVEGGEVFVELPDEAASKSAVSEATHHSGPASPQEALYEVIAVIRPEKWRQTKQALLAAGVAGVTQRRVLGRGRQQGLRYLSKVRDEENEGIRYLPKRMVCCVVPREQVADVVKAIVSANQTGSHGDGKIFVCPLEDAVRVRTGERGRSALT